MHIDAADVVVAELNLAGVQARANLQADPCEFAASGRRAADRSAGAVRGTCSTR
jgi:hypothetical protein